MQQIYVSEYFKGYNLFMKFINNIYSHPQKEIIEKRLKIIEFYDEYGRKATKDAFNVGRSTVFLWKKKLKENEGKLSVLASLSRAPKTPRKSKVPLSIRQFIQNYRTKHPRASKETIKPELDEYCRICGIKSISESTIGRIIKDLTQKNLIPRYQAKLSFQARTGRFIERKAIALYRKQRRKGYQPEKPGDLVQIDAISIFIKSIRKYLITAIDLKSRFAFSYAYDRLSSLNARDFMQKLQYVSPFEIKRIQTDNGAEFNKHFRRYIQEIKLVHFHNYPRRPQSNAYIERFNRTIQEQFVQWHYYDLKEDMITFNNNLIKYLIWYNTKKQHRSLNKLPPLKYYVNEFVKIPKKSNMLWTLTSN